MPQNMPWTRTLGAKLGATTLALLALAVALVAGNLYMLAGIKGDAAAANQLGLGRARAMEMLYLAYRLPEATGEQKARLVAQLRDAVERTDRRAKIFLEGDPTLGVLPATDPRIVKELQDRDQSWRIQLRPLVERVIAAPSADETRRLLGATEEAAGRFRQELDDGISAYQRISEEKVERFETLQYGFAVLVAVVLGLALWLGQNIGRRVRSLATTAERIGAGDLTLQAASAGGDEVAQLAGAFNAMTGNLRRTLEAEQAGRARVESLLATITETASSLASASSEILAGTTQQASGAQEQAAAVAETVSTVDEVLQTSEQAAQRAKAVAESSQRAAEIGRSGREAVEESVAAMGTVKEQTEQIAENILALAEQAQAIGEIIATVNDIAEQTNLLALNAGIEASRAGDHGAGFTVVAREIKDLADQAKKATTQVRQILGEIQKATNSAVMVTEEGTKSATQTLKAVNRAGETIKALAATVDEAARAAAQIAASAGQQATGMGQIQQAMKDINQTTSQNLASTQQAERAARDLNAMGTRLKSLLAT